MNPLVNIKMLLDVVDDRLAAKDFITAHELLDLIRRMIEQEEKSRRSLLIGGKALG